MNVRRRIGYLQYHIEKLAPYKDYPETNTEWLRMVEEIKTLRATLRDGKCQKV